MNLARINLAWIALALAGGCDSSNALPSGRDMAVSNGDAAVSAPPDFAAIDLAGADFAGVDLAIRPGTGCGTCPAGSTCGSANGHPVCRNSSTGIPLFSNVFVIFMENTSWDSLMGANNTPYLHGLITSAAYSSDYHGVTHPSLPNYLALTAGAPGVQMDGTTPVSCDCDPEGKTCDMCTTFSTLLNKCGCEQTAAHLGDQLDTAGKSWRNYGESMGSPCNLKSSGAYAARHVPFLYYTNVQTNVARCNDHVVDFGSFITDLAGTTRALSFIAPNLENDMHGTGLVQASGDLAKGDTWLKTNVGAIQLSNAYKAGGVVFIIWDEDDLSGVITKDEPIPFFVLSPFAKSGGFASATKVDHYSLLATLEDGLGVPRLGAAATAAPLSDFFPAN